LGNLGGNDQKQETEAKDSKIQRKLRSNAKSKGVRDKQSYLVKLRLALAYLGV
jgi:hypothetical protein